MLKRLFRRSEPGTRDAATTIREGVSHLEAGRPREARLCFERALAVGSADASAWTLIGFSHQHEGDHDAALSAFARAMTLSPEDADILAAAATSHRLRGDVDTALDAYRKALACDPGQAQIWNDCGLTLLESGRAAESIEPLRRAVALMPDRADIQFNLGNAYRAGGQASRALDAFRASLERDPGFVPGWNNLGTTHHLLGQFAPAIECFRRAISLAPDDADAHNNLGSALQGAGRPDEAVPCFRRALALNPGHRHAASNLAQAFQELGDDEAARAAFAQAMTIAPSDVLRVRMATVLPVIVPSREGIVEARSRLEQNIERLRADGVRLAQPEREVPTVNFHLAYHGLDDRPLQQALAALYLQACPALGWSAPRPAPQRSGRLRIGFVSRFLHGHSIGKTSRGLIAELDRKRFEAVAIHVPPVQDDDMARWIRGRADVNVDLPLDMQSARAVVAALELDVLFFQEIGMDAYTYFLAFSRLAPVQCVSFGHPDTTGIPNMDWWVSSENFEPDDGASHYSEQLWKARNVGTLAYYYRPPQPTLTLTRADLGLPARGGLYLVPHTVFRLHPDFDEVIAQVLDADPEGTLAVLEGRQPRWVERYLGRLRTTLGGRTSRVRVLPKQPHDRFLALVRLADAVLDPLHFNGMNNSLDAFSVGTPVVTFPQRFQRGRHTYGMYRHMGLDRCVANSVEDYARIAARLGRDPDFRRHASEEIAERADTLFEDARVVREFERFFEEARACAS